MEYKFLGYGNENSLRQYVVDFLKVPPNVADAVSPLLRSTAAKLVTPDPDSSGGMVFINTAFPPVSWAGGVLPRFDAASHGEDVRALVLQMSRSGSATLDMEEWATLATALAEEFESYTKKDKSYGALMLAWTHPKWMQQLNSNPLIVNTCLIVHVMSDENGEPLVCNGAVSSIELVNSPNKVN